MASNNPNVFVKFPMKFPGGLGYSPAAAGPVGGWSFTPGSNFFGKQPIDSLLPRLTGPGSTPRSNLKFGKRSFGKRSFGKRSFGYPLMNRPSQYLNDRTFPRYPAGDGSSPGGQGGLILQGLPSFQQYWGFGKGKGKGKGRRRSRRRSSRRSRRRSSRRTRRRSTRRRSSRRSQTRKKPLKTLENNLSKTQIKSGMITIDYNKFRRFFKVSNKALDQKTSKQVIETILNKYKNKMNKLGIAAAMKIVNNEYKKAGYKGNLSNDNIWIRDAVLPFLCKEKPKVFAKWKVVYKILK